MFLLSTLFPFYLGLLFLLLRLPLPLCSLLSFVRSFCCPLLSSGLCPPFPSLWTFHLLFLRPLFTLLLPFTSSHFSFSPFTSSPFPSRYLYPPAGQSDVKDKSPLLKDDCLKKKEEITDKRKRRAMRHVRRFYISAS